MCFSAEVSTGVAAVLLPTGVVSVVAVWRKRRFLPLAVIPFLFGIQQLGEAGVWRGLDLGDTEATRIPSLLFLFFALVWWPIWVPLAVAVVEPNGWRRWAFIAISGVGALFGAAYYLPLLEDSGRGLHPVVVGHSIRYDFTTAPATGWIWLAIYLLAVCGPFLLSHTRALRPLGLAVAVAAVGAYAFFEYAFASVWCFFSSILSLYLAYTLVRLRETRDLQPLAKSGITVASADGR
jgi:nitrate reductase NapE component